MYDARVVQVGTNPTLLAPGAVDALPGSSVVMSNPTGNPTVFVGGPTVTVAAGFPITAGDVVTVDRVVGTSSTAQHELYAIVATGTANVNVLVNGV